MRRVSKDGLMLRDARRRAPVFDELRTRVNALKAGSSA
jgi:hypothetical protein